MDNNTFATKINRFLEVFITTLFGDIPTLFLGSKLRNIFYKLIFSKLGKSGYIQNGAEFINTSSISIGDGVHIFKHVRLDAKGENNNLDLSDGVALEQGVKIGAMDNTTIQIHENTFLGPNVCIGGPGNITIGKDCLIAANCGIFANNHIFTDIHQKITAQGITREGIVIEDNCWLGCGVIVVDGVTIGEGSVIGAGSVVTRNIPPYSVAVGSPARVIKSRKQKESVLATANISRNQ
ncbi:acyltransferase [Calothrix sp. UHCC 0171]|uniref:acyltransferase n=1 Tax=Calothrix sp. UHCC 0171 TaxID=3110245 RepID=UPI002B215293|nr:acyltransferase [Calothrix sp. UHCC 0171]MEA5572914.1 acyltransferase [Calothrix sp. UHCC 0171]